MTFGFVTFKAIDFGSLELIIPTKGQVELPGPCSSSTSFIFHLFVGVPCDLSVACYHLLVAIDSEIPGNA